MNLRRNFYRLHPVLTAAGLLLSLTTTLAPTALRAQGSADLQARVTELKESQAKNKQALAQYSWEETVKIILKGEEKKTEHFEVRQGPDGKPVKTSLDQPAAPRKNNPAVAVVGSSNTSSKRKRKNTRITRTR